MSRRVLVTGASGFLGRSVVPRLAAGPDVALVVAADLTVPDPSPDDPSPDGPGPDDPSPDGVVHALLDVTDAERVSALVAEHHVDTVVHLASVVNPGRGASREHAYRVDVDGTRHVLDACLEHGVGRIVVSSSGAAYGYHPDNPAWITEDQPVRGNDAFAYSRHKRLVEEMLAREREEHPALEQTVLRIGTILGETVDNQITDLFRSARVLKIAGADSPFVFIWDTDLVEVVARAVTGAWTGVVNVAGDGALTIDEIAARLGKRTLPVPELLLKAALAVARPLRLSQYGPEQTMFLRHRPVLDNTRLRTGLGYVPARTSSEAFDAWAATLS